MHCHERVSFERSSAVPVSELVICLVCVYKPLFVPRKPLHGSFQRRTTSSATAAPLQVCLVVPLIRQELCVVQHFFDSCPKGSLRAFPSVFPKLFDVDRKLMKYVPPRAFCPFDFIHLCSSSEVCSSFQCFSMIDCARVLRVCFVADLPTLTADR